MLVAIRDAESRTRFLGYRVETYKLFVFTLSACMAGVAGALYVPQVGIINPSEFAPGQFHRGGDLGRGRRPRHAGRRGARRGRSSTTPRPTSPPASLAPYWLFVLGGLFVAVTLFLPRGIVGTIAPLVGASAQRASGGDAADADGGRRRRRRRPAE